MLYSFRLSAQKFLHPNVLSFFIVTGNQKGYLYKRNPSDVETMNCKGELKSDPFEHSEM